MQNNFYFLRQLSAALHHTLVGYTVVSCFSQNKDELLMELNNGQQSFFIKANLSTSFCCLSFPRIFHRAHKNSIDLFKEIILQKVTAVIQFENERSFSIELENDAALIFKMHGNFSNVLLAKGNRVMEIFKNELTTDFAIDKNEMNRSIDFGKENFEKNNSSLRAYFTFGKLVFDYLKTKHWETLDEEAKWNLLQDTLKELNHPKYYLIERNNKLIFSLLPLEKIVNEFTDPIQAVNKFSEQAIHHRVFDTQKNELLRQLQGKLRGSESYVKKNTQKLNELMNDHHYQRWADLIMANMNKIDAGQKQIVLSDFYDGRDVEIKLKPELTPQKNAEAYYRKAKHQQIEIDKIKEALAQKELEISALQKKIETVEHADDLKTIHQETKHDGKKEQFKNLPYHEFEYKGYRIWVGRNADANDQLTLKYSYKEDLWLHAKDVAGSHVLIKHQAGKKFPKEVIEYAARLAAFNSKRKNESLCPVAFTPKKYVRKRKGDRAGMVVVEREEVILVEPIS